VNRKNPLGEFIFKVRARKVGTVNRPCCISYLNRENGSPFRERPSICHKKKSVSTCLAEVKLSSRVQVYHVAMKNGGTLTAPGWSPRGFSMTCDLSRVASQPPSVDGLCFINCGLYSGDLDDTSWGTAPITS
jgi:hypothetical protein